MNIGNKLIFIILGAYTLLSAYEDIRHREISLLQACIFAVTGSIFTWLNHRVMSDTLAAFIPAIIIYVLSKLTRGSVGTGDAIFTGVCALYLDCISLCVCIAFAWGMCAITSLIIIASGCMKAGARYKYCRGLPFVAYMLPPISIMCFRALCVV